MEDDQEAAYIDSFFLPGGILDPYSYEEEEEERQQQQAKQQAQAQAHQALPPVAAVASDLPEPQLLHGSASSFVPATFKAGLPKALDKTSTAVPVLASSAAPPPQHSTPFDHPPQTTTPKSSLFGPTPSTTTPSAATSTSDNPWGLGQSLFTGTTSHSIFPQPQQQPSSSPPPPPLAPPNEAQISKPRPPPGFEHAVPSQDDYLTPDEDEHDDESDDGVLSVTSSLTTSTDGEDAYDDDEEDYSEEKQPIMAQEEEEEEQDKGHLMDEPPAVEFDAEYHQKQQDENADSEMEQPSEQQTAQQQPFESPKEAPDNTVEEKPQKQKSEQPKPTPTTTTPITNIANPQKKRRHRASRHSKKTTQQQQEERPDAAAAATEPAIAEKHPLPSSKKIRKPTGPTIGDALQKVVISFQPQIENVCHVMERVTRVISLFCSIQIVCIRASWNELLEDDYASSIYIFFVTFEFVTSQLSAILSLPHWFSHLFFFLGIWQLCSNEPNNTDNNRTEQEYPNHNNKRSGYMTTTTTTGGLTSTSNNQTLLYSIRIIAFINLILDGLSTPHPNVICVLPHEWMRVLAFVLLCCRNGYQSSTLMWLSLAVQIVFMFLPLYWYTQTMIGLSSLHYKRILVLRTTKVE